jgi:hypothetical protein
MIVKQFDNTREGILQCNAKAFADRNPIPVKVVRKCPLRLNCSSRVEEIRSRRIPEAMFTARLRGSAEGQQCPDKI